MIRDVVTILSLRDIHQLSSTCRAARDIVGADLTQYVSAASGTARSFKEKSRIIARFGNLRSLTLTRDNPDSSPIFVTSPTRDVGMCEIPECVEHLEVDSWCGATFARIPRGMRSIVVHGRRASIFKNASISAAMELEQLVCDLREYDIIMHTLRHSGKLRILVINEDPFEGPSIFERLPPGSSLDFGNLRYLDVGFVSIALIEKMPKLEHLITSICPHEDYSAIESRGLLRNLHHLEITSTPDEFDIAHFLSCPIKYLVISCSAEYNYQVSHIPDNFIANVVSIFILNEDISALFRHALSIAGRHNVVKSFESADDLDSANEYFTHINPSQRAISF